MENMGCYLPNSVGGYGGDILWKTSPSSTSTSSGGNLKSVGSQEYLSGGGVGGGGGCRSPSSSLTEFNMCSFPLSPFDLEPLPNIFSFAPCTTTYKDIPAVYKEKNPQDMADVLLSLKHAIVHPSQMASAGGSLPSLSPVGNYGPYVGQPPTSMGNTSNGGGGGGGSAATHLSPTSVSFSVQPQAQVINPSHHGYSSQYAQQYPIGDTSGIASTTSAGGIGCNVPSAIVNNSSGGMHHYHHHHHPSPHQNLTGHGGSQGPPNIFPSMSVNVSMNMTMGVPGVPNPYNMMEQMCSPHHHHHHHHQQWPGSTVTPGLVTSAGGTTSQSYGTSSTAAINTGSLLPQSQTNLMAPLQMSYAANPAQHSGSYVGTPGSYSFTAEFRPSPACSNDVPINSTFDKDFGLPLKNVNMNVVTPFKPMKSSTGSSHSPVNVGFSQVNKKRSSLSQSLSSTSRLPCSMIVNGIATSHSTEGTPVTIPGEYMSDIASKLNLCRICGKTYARPSTLKTHMRTHSGEKPYRCSTCHKSFSQAANLTAHIRTHSGEKPFQCSICDRRFSQSSSVTTHMRTHSGERPYRCRACKKAFSDSSTLTKHLRIHSGEKPYQCKLCLLRFSQSGNLNRHMRVHSNPI